MESVLVVRTQVRLRRYMGSIVRIWPRLLREEGMKDRSCSIWIDRACNNIDDWDFVHCERNRRQPK